MQIHTASVVLFVANLLGFYECLDSGENCSEDRVSTNSDKQTVCAPAEDWCILVYSRDKNREHFKIAINQNIQVCHSIGLQSFCSKSV